MNESIFDEQTVRDCYAWVFRCVEAYREYRSIAWDLSVNHKDEKGPERVRPTKEILRRLAECVSEMQSAGERGKALVDALVWHAPAVNKEPVKFSFVNASSWAEATVRLLATTVERSKDWLAFDGEDEDTQGYMIRVLMMKPIEPDLLESMVKQEAARLRDRAVSLSAYERYGYVLMKLKPQSQRILKLLIDHQGRTVSNETMEEALWSEDARAGKDLRSRRSSAMSELRSELRNEGFAELRAGIVTDGALGYRLK